MRLEALVEGIFINLAKIYDAHGNALTIGTLLEKMKKISVSLSGHQTSITLESEFFDALQKLSIRQNRSVASIINEIDSARPANRNLSSAVRVWVLQQTILRFSDNS